MRPSDQVHNHGSNHAGRKHRNHEGAGNQSHKLGCSLLTRTPSVPYFLCFQLISLPNSCSAVASSMKQSGSHHRSSAYRCRSPAGGRERAVSCIGDCRLTRRRRSEAFAMDEFARGQSFCRHAKGLIRRHRGRALGKQCTSDEILSKIVLLFRDRTRD